MDNIDNIAKQFENILDLQKYSDQQFALIQKQNLIIGRLQAEIAHLKSVLSASPLVDDKSVKLITSTEQTICEIEIERLKETAMSRGLTLEETKRLDLLVKNLFLAKEQKKDVAPSFRNLNNVSNATLIEIASQPEAVEDA
jgi:hypothetical protein